MCSHDCASSCCLGPSVGAAAAAHVHRVLQPAAPAVRVAAAAEEDQQTNRTGATAPDATWLNLLSLQSIFQQLVLCTVSCHSPR